MLGLKRVLLAIGAAVLVVAVAFGAAQQPAEAEPSYIDLAVNSTSTKLDFAAAAGAVASVSQSDALTAVKTFTAAPATATVRSVDLAVLRTLGRQPELVWAVDIDGLDMPAASRGPILDSDGTMADRTIRRAVVMVSATQPDFVMALFSYTPAQK